MIITHKDPRQFHTRSVELAPYRHGINITAVGERINFNSLQKRRKPCQSKIPGTFANLGVSAQVHLRTDNTDYLILVRQFKDDHWQLKLPSGYIPDEQLHNPYLTLAQEIAEECLLENGPAFARCRLNNDLLAPAYKELAYCSEVLLELQSSPWNPLHLPQTDIYMNERLLPGNPMLYIHSQTCSAQLVYPLEVTRLPDTQLSLLHAEEEYNWETEQLDVVLNQELWLAKLDNRQIYALGKFIDGRYQQQPTPANTRLSEVFAHQG